MSPSDSDLTVSVLVLTACTIEFLESSVNALLMNR